MSENENQMNVSIKHIKTSEIYVQYKQGHFNFMFDEHVKRIYKTEFVMGE